MAKGKKKVKGFLSALLALTMCGSTVAFAACGNSGPYIGEDGYWYVNGEKTDVLAKGEKGDKGETGATGATGEKGDAGEKGETGDKGAQGNKGDKGETGDKGSTGKPGIILNGEGDLYKASGAITEKEGVVSPVDKFADGNLPYDGKFYMDYPDLATAQAAAHELAVQVAAEGDVLLKNEDGALPLADTERKVTLLGIRNARMVRSGFGSGSGGGSAISTLLADSLEEEGFSVNRKLLAHYTKQIGLMDEDKILELNPNTYGASLTSTYASYNDAAVVVFSRTGAENFDIATNGLAGQGYSNDDAHKLQLDDNEKLLVKHAKANFKKVIVLINSSNIMEIPELDAPTSTEYGVDAILWVGSVGQDGTDAIAKILTGEVNPSGHTVDLWEKDFKKSPTWTNFGTGKQNKDANGDRLDALYYGPKGESTYFADVEYREGIYYGYKYYETRYMDNTDKTEAYENVLYPYGYGLSYTTFDWVLDNVSTTGTIAGADSQITMRVWVKNSGLVPGKDVVQIYYSAPFTKNGIEKAGVNLVGFGKTKLLQPGESDIVTVTFNAQDMASYDWNDLNGNGFSGYELEAGDYKIVAAHNSHEAVQLAMGEPDATLKTDYKTADGTTDMSRKGFAVTRTVAQAADDTATNGKTGIKCETDLVTGKKIENVYFAEKEDGTKVVEAVKGDDGKDNIAGILSHNDHRSVNVSLTEGMISRSDEGGLKQPEPASRADRTLSAEVLADWNSQENYYSFQDKATDPWYVKAAPSSWDQATDDTAALKISLADVAGLDYVEYVLKDGVPTLPEDMTQAQKDANAKWEQFMNQFTWEELCLLPTQANNIIPRLGAIGTGRSEFKYGDPDGPINAAGVQFPSNPILAATYNLELAEEEGRMVGNLLVLNGSGGWRGAGADIHRSPFSGRNFEYYSEDGVTSGLIGAAVTKGVTEKGIIAHFKHFFGNDQEAYRADYGGVFTWATEQQIREQMAKPFEYIIKYGGTIGLMNSFNRIGKWTQSTNFATHERLLNQEWDFKGSCEGDAWAKQFVPLNLGVRGGDDELLSADSGFPPNALERGKWDATKKTVLVAKDKAEYDANGGYLSDKGVGSLESPTHYYNVRKCAQRLLQTMANSVVNQNGFAAVEEVKYTLTKGIYNAITLNIPEKTDDVVFTFAKDVVWPKGMSYNATTGILSGVPTEDTAADVSGTFTCDSWITKVPKNVKFKFEVETDIRFAGKNIKNGGKVDTTATAMASGVTIDAGKLQYGKQLWLSTRNVRIMNAYQLASDNKWYHRDEDKSAADIITLGQYVKGMSDKVADVEKLLKDGTLAQAHLYEFSIEGLPEGVTVTKNLTQEMGWMGKASYEVNTSLGLKGTIAAGDYEITVTLYVPNVNKSTNPWMSANANMLTYTVAFTLHVA